MTVFVIGDVHGCFYTFNKMVKDHWKPDTERLVQLGDLVDRGNHSPQTVQFAQQLKKDYPEQVFFLKGNHEFEMLKHFRNSANPNWLRQGGRETISQYAAIGRDIEEDVRWIEALPLFFEQDHLYVSHAGIAEGVSDPFNEDSPLSILWNRNRLKPLGKLQLVGHTPMKKPKYDPVSHAYYIDTGAVYGQHLTGVKISDSGEVLQWLKVKTDNRDR